MRLIELKGLVRDRMIAAKDLLVAQGGSEQYHNLKPSSARLVLSTSPTLERFWGAFIVNVRGQKGRPGRAGQEVDFAYAMKLHFWFNRFDRIWDVEAVGGNQDIVPLCEAFSFDGLNAVRFDGVPRRVIARLEEPCGAATSSSTASDTERMKQVIVVRDHLLDRVRNR